jgi:hypothetical protein
MGKIAEKFCVLCRVFFESLKRDCEDVDRIQLPYDCGGI